MKHLKLAMHTGEESSFGSRQPGLTLISLQRGNFSGTKGKQKHFIYGFKLGMVTITDSNIAVSDLQR